MPQPAPLLHLDAIVKKFGNRTVLRSISAVIDEGDAVVIMGPNGAGKSTLLKIISGLLKPTSGQIHRSKGDSARTLGFVGHDSFCYANLTAEENLRFYLGLYGKGADPLEILDRVGLAYAARQRTGTFSRGMMQRLAIARALIHEPPILLLDEPFTGLDRDGMAVFQDILAHHRGKGGALILVSHDFVQAASIGDKFYLLSNGRMKAYDGKAPQATDLQAFYHHAVTGTGKIATAG